MRTIKISAYAFINEVPIPMPIQDAVSYNFADGRRPPFS